MAKSKLVQFLVVGIVVLVLLSSGEVFAEQHKDTSAADDWSDAEDWLAELHREVMESYNEDGSSDPWQTVAEQGVVEGSGQLPFEEYNSPPDISGGQQVEQNKKQISHPICPGAVGDLTLDLTYDIRETNGMQYIECRYVETRYVAGHYQTYILASFTVAWAEDNSVSDAIKKQLCLPSYIGWEEWSDNGKVASITDVYLHDDEIALKDELKKAIKEGLGKAEARALPCGGGDEEEENCDEYCKNRVEHAIWDEESDYPECGCICEKGWQMEDLGCVPCEDICQQSDSRAHYDPNDLYSSDNNCGCSCEGKLLEYEFNECRCVIGAHDPDGDGECECKPGYEISVWGGKCEYVGGDENLDDAPELTDEERRERVEEIPSASTFPAYDSTKNYCGPQHWEDRWGIHGPSSSLTFGADFNYACYEHDKCYGECEKPGNTQAHCDQVFRDMMDDSCDQAFDTQMKTCDAISGGISYKYYACIAMTRLQVSGCWTQAAINQGIAAMGGKVVGSYPC